MSLPAAYLGAVLIWATTPLGIKWSGDGASFLFGVTSRMVLGSVLCVAILLVLRHRLPWHTAAWRTYGAAAMGLYGSLICVYWAAQYTTSGVISVFFGMTPLMTSLFAAIILGERSLTGPKIIGMMLGVVGLAVVFGGDLARQGQSLYGLWGLSMAVLLHALSAVLVKRQNSGLPALSVTTGGLLLALPCYLLTWWVLDGVWPEQLPLRTLTSIIYLGVFGSVVGFFLYFYILRHSSASSAALITLVTPVLALIIGHQFNGEPLDLAIWLGATFILVGLAIHQWGGTLLRRLSVHPVK